MIRSILSYLARRIARPHVQAATARVHAELIPELEALRAENARISARLAKDRRLTDAERAVPCDECGSQAGAVCRYRRGDHGVRCRPHASRAAAWRARQGQAAEMQAGAETQPWPRPCAAGVTLPPVVSLPEGGADAARQAPGRDGSWPAPRPGYFGEGGDCEENEGC